MKNLINVPQNLIKLATAVAQHGGNLYVVGGFVRNQLLGYSVGDGGDIDIAGSLQGADMQQVCSQLKFNTNVINEKLGTLVIRAGKDLFEYTTFRREEYEGGGEHSPSSVQFVADIESDSARRDFTVNSIYYDILNNKLLDFYNGLTDIKTKTLKCIISPKQVFKNDGLRILRFIRFACELNFKFDPLSYKTAKNNTFMLSDISSERKLKELKSIVNAESKYNLYYNQPVRMIKILNRFNLYKYLFNSSFNGLKVSTHSRLFKAFQKATLPTRYYAFILLVLNQYITGATTKSNIHYLVNTMLGVNGLKESNENITKIIKLFTFYQTLKATKQTTNQLCIEYSGFSKPHQQLIADIYPKRIAKLNNKIAQLKTADVPFVMGDLKISNTQLIEAGINPKLINQIKIILFNEAVLQNVLNTQTDLLNHAITLSQKYKQ